MQAIRDKYLYNKTQIITLNNNGIVLESNNSIFVIEIDVYVGDFHPFFETIIPILGTEDQELIFYCVHCERTEMIMDILFNSGNKNQNPFVILFDFTDHYSNFQNIAQEKNETVLNFHLEELKTRQLVAEKEFKNKFLANVGHDLKTPINATNWFIGMLQKLTPTNTQAEILDLLNESNQIVKTLIDDILDLSKIELGKMELHPQNVDIYKMLHTLNEIYLPKARQKKLTFQLNIKPNTPQFINADLVRLQQILINLLDNSIKFTNQGTIQLLAEKTPNNTLQFTIIDSGIGFTTTNKTDAYQSFTKLHNHQIEGSGLGLSIVANLVQLMNGNINYESQLNKGTTFSIQIPI